MLIVKLLMNFYKIIIFFCLQIRSPLAYPGQFVVDFFQHHFARLNFYYEPYGYSKDVILDNFYMDFMTTESDLKANYHRQKISVYTFYYLLMLKLQQNSEKLRNMRVQLWNEEAKPHKGPTSAFQFLAYGLIGNLFKAMWSNYDDCGMCLFLQFAEDLKTALMPNPMEKFGEKKADCADEETAKVVVYMNYEQIQDWVLSDLMQNLPKRKRLSKHLGEILNGNDQRAIKIILWKFSNFLGYARLTMLFKKYSQLMGNLLPPADSNLFYEMTYRSYFVAVEMEQQKWRTKIVMEKNLYDEWAEKFFAGELEKIKDEAEYNLVYFEKGPKMRAKFVGELSECWTVIMEDFWQCEKFIREKIATIARKTKVNVPKWKEILAIVPEEREFMLWEYGPLDTSLLRALAICVGDVVSEYTSKWKNAENLEEFGTSMLTKYFICLWRNLKNQGQKKDEMVAKLQKDKLAKIAVETDNEKFLHYLRKYKYIWKPLVDSKGLKHIEELLNEEYVAAPETFSSHSSSFTDEEEKAVGSEESFIDASESFEDDENESHNANSQNEKEKSEKKLNPEEKAQEIYGMEKILEHKLRKQKLKEAKNKTPKVMNRGEKLKQMSGKSDFENKLIWEELARRDQKWTKTMETLTGQKMTQKSVKIASKNTNQKEIIEKKIVEQQRQQIQYQTDHCIITMMKQIEKAHAMRDLLNDEIATELYRIYLDTKMDQNCVAILHISTLMRSVQAKIHTYSDQNVLINIFEIGWTQFLGMELAKTEDVQFVIEKLYFVHKKLDDILTGHSNNGFIEKIVEILGEPKLDRIGNKNSANDKKSVQHSRIINNKVEQNVKISIIKSDKTPKVFETKMTQFGSYHVENLNSLLEQLHAISLAILSAKNAQFQLKNNGANSNQNTEWIARLLGQKFEEQRDGFGKMVNALQTILKQQKLDEKLYEWNQYELVRTDAKQRENDLKASEELSKFVLENSIKPEKRRLAWLLRKQLETIAHRWVQKISPHYKKPILLPTGSLMLKAELDESDADLLCVVPMQINMYKFNGVEDGSMYSLLKAHLNGSGDKVNSIGGRVPLIEVVHAGMDIDLMLVPIPENLFGTSMESDEIVRQMKFEAGIYSLAGYRAGKFQLSMVPDQKQFSSLLIAAKIWAKNRLIYSGIFGFLNGAALSIMATKICALFPNAPMLYLLQRFFAVFASWNWTKDPLMLDELSKEPLNKIVLKWPPKIDTDSMSIISPKFPEQNTVFNVNRFTFKTIVEELQIAHQVLVENPQNWRQIFEKVDYSQKFSHFAIIFCSEKVGLEQSQCAYQKTQIRLHLAEWENREKVAQKIKKFHAIPHYEKKQKCQVANIIDLCHVWLVGLSLESEIELNSELPPIFALEQNFKSEKLLVRTIYADAKKLDKRINELMNIETPLAQD